MTQHNDFQKGKKSTQLQQGEVLIGYIQGITKQGKAEVSFHANQQIHTYVALTTLPVSMELLGRNVVLSFVEGDLSQPIIMGLLWEPDHQAPKSKPKTAAQATTPYPDQQPESLSDFKIIRAADRIELTCGQASITLTHTGKIMLRGQMISSQAAGAHRIKGGSVQIN